MHESVFKSINTAVGDLSCREKGYRRMGPPAFVSVCTARRVWAWGSLDLQAAGGMSPVAGYPYSWWVGRVYWLCLLWS